jgi:hypothetical protein
MKTVYIIMMGYAGMGESPHSAFTNKIEAEKALANRRLRSDGSSWTWNIIKISLYETLEEAQR